jgi:hypothetical protein
MTKFWHEIIVEANRFRIAAVAVGQRESGFAPATLAISADRSPA